jgi:hypothetical protein
MIIILPLAVAGALPAMITETILTPILASTSRGVMFQLQIMIAAMGIGIIGVVFGLSSWIGELRRREHLWLALGAIGLLARALLLDLEAGVDLLGLMLFVALGVGLFVQRFDQPRQVLISLFVGTLIVGAGVSALMIPYPEAGPTDDHVFNRSETNVPSIDVIYWEKIKPKQCHYRLSLKELKWIEMTDSKLTERQCDPWPF